MECGIQQLELKTTHPLDVKKKNPPSHFWSRERMHWGQKNLGSLIYSLNVALDCSRYRKTKTTSPVAQTGKNLPAMWETGAPSLGWEDPLDEGVITHSSVLTWRIPMDRGAWRATVHGVAKTDSDTTERPNPASVAAVDIGPALVCEAATCFRGKLNTG